MNHLPIVEYLISKGANIEAKDNDDQTPLHWASKHGNTNVVKYLVSKGANKTTRDKDGKIPCDLADTDEIRIILK